MDIANKTSTATVEAWITKTRLQLSGRLVFQDESVQEFDIGSLSYRGAQREVTGSMKAQGFDPQGRWEEQADDDGTDEYAECSRAFRRAS